MNYCYGCNQYEEVETCCEMCPGDCVACRCESKYEYPSNGRKDGPICNNCINEYNEIIEKLKKTVYYWLLIYKQIKIPKDVSKLIAQKIYYDTSIRKLYKEF